MSLPTPEPGLVIRYAYLWRAEAERGLEEGLKDRPCTVVLASHRRESGTMVVVVAPITHSEPIADSNALEIPATVKRRLGLDSARSWLITNDLNSFIWPGPDLRSIDPRTPQAGFIYGFLPDALVREVLTRIRTQMRAGGINPVQRTE